MPRHVIFLGAGFSAPLGLPIMRSFFDHVAGLPRVSDDVKGWLTELQRDARGAQSMILGDEFNLEHVLSLALMRHESVGPSPEHLPPAYDRIARLLGTVYRAIAPDRITQEILERLRQLLTFFPKEKSVLPGTELTVITTNYDLMAEYTLLRLGAPATLPIATHPFGGQPPAGALLYATAGPMLCKLHGSVNWFSKPNSSDPVRMEAGTVTRFLRDKSGTVTKVLRSDHGGHVVFPKVSLEAWAPEETPLIVPPMYFKHQTDERLNPNWAVASNALRSADRLAFVGYSFPGSDTHMRYFLAAALHNNMKLKAVSVVDPKAADVCKRVTKSEDFGNTFKQLLRPIDTPWNEGVFTLD